MYFSRHRGKYACLMLPDTSIDQIIQKILNLRTSVSEFLFAKQTHGVKMDNRNRLEQELKTYVNKYLGKDWIKMKAVLRGIKVDLESKGYIDKKALHSLLGLLKKETKFNRLSDDQISNYFKPLLSKPDTTSTLDAFM